MYCDSLNGAWQFRQVGKNEWQPGQVPGGVHTDLLNLGLIPDPFVEDNEKKVMWVAETDWEYKRTFQVSAEIRAEEKIFLVCDGIDTIADVYLNDTFLGHTENMFRRFEWDIKALLRDGENELRFFFASPVKYTRGKQAQLPLTGGGDIPGGPHLRKAPYQWGWDWGPKLPPIGIWKDIRLEGYSLARFSDVAIRQKHEDAVTLYAGAYFERWAKADLRVVFQITSPDGKTWEVASDEEEDGVFIVETLVEHPQLWWPNGYGAQPLYQVTLTLQSGKELLDKREYKIGLRTLELHQPVDEWGKGFYFVVNGAPVFAKGADWIPAESFPTRLTEAHLEHLIGSATLAHMNMLRIWGGGYYPEDIFFDLCDRYGILIWQDFMFACGIYPADEAFFESVRVEAVENVRRLRHHASLALWCGNNEMEQGWVDWGWNKPEDALNQRLKDGYDRMFHHMLPEIVNLEDSDHPYWPSSASSGVPFQKPNGQEQGDTHYWDVWHGRRPFTAYRGQYPRFMSEFGFQALPPFKTIATYAKEADQNMTSYVMEHHQRSGSGNGLMIAQMTDTFRMPKDFASLVYLSMVLQAEGIRYGVEHWRRNRKRVGGTLYWQLNDCWPVASWASLDYYGRWKALHYAARRFYAPVLLSVEDSGSRMNVHLTSDLMTPWDGKVCWRLETLNGKRFESGEQIVRAQALADILVCTPDFSNHVNEANKRELIFICELWQDEAMLSWLVIPFVPNKHLKLADPKLTAKVRLEGSQLSFDLSARTLARFVELELEGADAVFSDNYFDISAGQKVTITCPIPPGWTLEKAQRALKVRSLYQSFA